MSQDKKVPMSSDEIAIRERIAELIIDGDDALLKVIVELLIELRGANNAVETAQHLRATVIRRITSVLKLEERIVTSSSDAPTEEVETREVEKAELPDDAILVIPQPQAEFIQGIPKGLVGKVSAEAWRTRPTGLTPPDSIPRSFTNQLRIDGDRERLLIYLTTQPRDASLVLSDIEVAHKFHSTSLRTSAYKTLINRMNTVLTWLGYVVTEPCPAITDENVNWFLNELLNEEYRENWILMFTIAAGHMLFIKVDGTDQSIFDPRRLLQKSVGKTEEKEEVATDEELPTPTLVDKLENAVNFDAERPEGISDPRNVFKHPKHILWVAGNQVMYIGYLVDLRDILRDPGMTGSNVHQELEDLPAKSISSVILGLRKKIHRVLHLCLGFEVDEWIPSIQDERINWFLNTFLTDVETRVVWEQLFLIVGGQQLKTQGPDILNFDFVPSIHPESPLRMYPSSHQIYVLSMLMNDEYLRLREKGQQAHLMTQHADAWGFSTPQAEGILNDLAALAESMIDFFITECGGQEIQYLSKIGSEIVKCWKDHPWSLGLWDLFWTPFFELLGGIRREDLRTALDPTKPMPEKEANGLPDIDPVDHLALSAPEVDRYSRHPKSDKG